MMKVLIFGALLAGISTQSHAACNDKQSFKWLPGVKIVATAQGTTCQNVEIDLQVQANGKTIWREKLQSKFLMGGEATDNRTQLKLSMKTWFAPPARPSKTSDMPAWPVGYKGDLPEGAEFPFMPESGLTQKSYSNVRKANLPMYCYVAGSEHQRCVYFHNGQILNFGDQRFPG